MARSKITIQNQPWESNKTTNQKFTKICDDMQDSMAWHDLGLEAQGLYLFIKKKYTKKSDGSTNENDIHIVNVNTKMYKKGNLFMYKKRNEIVHLI